jgi:hypothetical protein
MPLAHATEITIAELHESDVRGTLVAPTITVAIPSYFAGWSRDSVRGLRQTQRGCPGPISEHL